MSCHPQPGFPRSRPPVRTSPTNIFSFQQNERRVYDNAVPTASMQDEGGKFGRIKCNRSIIEIDLLLLIRVTLWLTFSAILRFDKIAPLFHTRSDVARGFYYI